MYLDYDNLYVTVKADKLEDITRYYGYLGWERVAVKEHKIYRDELNLSFRRPHGIADKDARQLMQVYLDEALNELARIRARYCPKSVAFTVIFSLLSCAAITSGLCLAFILGGLWLWGGIAIAAFGGALAVFTTVTAVISFKKEKVARGKREIELNNTVMRVCEAAKKLGGESLDR